MARQATFTPAALNALADLAGLVAQTEVKKATLSAKEVAAKRAQKALGQIQSLKERKFFNTVKIRFEKDNEGKEIKVLAKKGEKFDTEEQRIVELKPVKMTRDKKASKEAGTDVMKHANNCALQRVIRLVSSPYNMTAAEVRESTIHTDGVCAPDWIVADLLGRGLPKPQLASLFEVICEKVPEATRDELFPTLFGEETVTASDVETVQAEQLSDVETVQAEQLQASA